MRESARLTATHYSTQIEGNRLTQEQVEEVLLGGTFPNRERDELEVKNYYQAIDYVDRLLKQNASTISEQSVKTIHGLVMTGQEKPTLIVTAKMSSETVLQAGLFICPQKQKMCPF